MQLYGNLRCAVFHIIKCLITPYFTEYEYIMNVQLENSNQDEERAVDTIYHLVQV